MPKSRHQLTAECFSRDFNVDDAERFLKDDLRWRKSTKIDKLRLEDFADIASSYPVHIDTYDKNGAPVITAISGQWDLRQAHLSGQGQRAQLFLDKVMDEAANQVRRAQHEGKNVTRFHFLLNLDGFNLVQHGCPRCFIGILTFLRSYESHFPGLTDRIVIFNAPQTLQTLRPLVRSAISGHTRRHLKLFGTNKAEWQKYLLEFIDKDQLTEDFGGTRIRYADIA
ncbi:SEC14-like protein 2 [Orchesella cincta]|uniref:SEC14-like protein 2 n=1 Tax=Orchesella cincta TaxID=48709 RepID=A0A1D2MJX6_ORCCI|nr:SEC14-like protein 2 [Orchesella cincta]